MNYVNFMNFKAKLYGDKNVFPWMGEYNSLTDYANVVNGYDGIINQTSKSTHEKKIGSFRYRSQVFLPQQLEV